MKVVVPYTAMAPETVAALYDAHENFECVYVGGNNSAYWELLSELWRQREDFALVEQDIVVDPSTIAGFDTCGHALCAGPYAYLKSEAYAGLGCIRFRHSVMRDHPDLWERVGAMSDARHPQHHWCTCDAFMQRVLGHRGMWPPHRHTSVGHLHCVPSHGCVPAEFLPLEAA